MRPFASLLVGLVVAQGLSCGSAQTPTSPPPAPPPPAPLSEPEPAVANVQRLPYEQPKSCPPPLTWEDGKPIEVSQVCPQHPEFYLHEGACCQYPNGCVAPQRVASYPDLERCEKARAAEEARSKKPPLCQPEELRWEPKFCVFAPCEKGQFSTPQREQEDCQTPLVLKLSFDQDKKTLSTNQIGQIENLAKMADVLGVSQLHVDGGQSYEEAPDAKSKAPLSLQRANAVKDALAKATRIPIEVHDVGTANRQQGSPDIFRAVSLRMAPLGEDRSAAQTTPFTLPWKVCESRVTFRTELALTKHDGELLVEVCRDKACSRSTLQSSYHAAWPGGTWAKMGGALKASLSLEATPQQQIRNALNAHANGGVPGELDGEKPATFLFKASFEDPAISPASIYSLRLSRRRSEIALEWSGKLDFVRSLRHPTRDTTPCLQAELEIPKAQHKLH